MALSIGQVADAADVNIQTIRYYERRGLFPTPRRTPAGYRQYADEAVARLRFIKHAQELGFSLQEVQELLACGSDTALPAMSSSGKPDRRSRSSNRGSVTSN